MTDENKSKQYLPIAKAIMKAQSFHESSWDEDHMTYTLTQEEAARKACGDDSDLVALVTYLNSTAWNDVQDWSTRIINKENKG
jgi:hypothetical protein